MTRYIDKVDQLLKDYYGILSEDYPEFLDEYIDTTRMQMQDRISCSCGTYYSNMFEVSLWYSSLQHSIAVALVIWHFTHDKKQTLAGLFHDIATPAFKHCIDFMNKDYEKQESTEDLTRRLIEESEDIMKLLKRDGITVDDVADYKIYPIADNDTPMLSADRLEYTLSNGLGQVIKLWDLDEVKKIYSNIVVVDKEDGTPEMCFKDRSVAERFVEIIGELSIYYMNDRRRFGMQFLADIMKRMSELGLIKVEDLYQLSEDEIIKMIEKCDSCNIAECFKIWRTADNVKTSDVEVPNKYCIKVKAKRRYIDPLVKTENGVDRISKISTKAQEDINKVLDYSFDRYVYMDFNFNDDVKTLSKM